QGRELLPELAALLLELARLVPLPLHDVVRGVPGESFVLEPFARSRELARDALDLGAQARRLALHVDHALERHEHLRAVLQDRVRAHAGARAAFDAPDPGQTLERRP